ncbi:hypothetical protein B0H14DRAFT_3909246 [Mycena olivaceomarginata]|nr:hypothetical protein B0H14DRAFT_3909246 [Mycena olivaceomarginata]
MRPTSTAALLAAATLIGATTINIPHTATVNRTTGCATTTGSTVSPNTTPSKAAPARATTSTSRALLGLHRSTGMGFFFETDAGPSGSKYSAEKILLVDPNGVDGGWAGASSKLPSRGPPIRSDLQFVSDLLDEIRTGCLPSAAAFHTIACAPVCGNFAAFATGSGSFFTDNGGVSSLTDVPTSLSRACSRAPPLPVLESHCGSDMDGPYAGGAGEGGTEPAIARPLGYAQWLHGREHDRDARQRARVPLSLNPIFISYHSTLLLLLVPCVSLRPTLSALPILLRILVPTLLTCTSHDGPSFYHCLPSFLPPPCFPILSAPPIPPPISPSHCWASPSLNSFEISVEHGRTTFNASTIVMAPCTRARTPLPVREIHGGIDTDVPYSGGAGEGGMEPAIPDWSVVSSPFRPSLFFLPPVARCSAGEVIPFTLY